MAWRCCRCLDITAAVTVPRSALTAVPRAEQQETESASRGRVSTRKKATKQCSISVRCRLLWRMSAGHSRSCWSVRVDGCVRLDASGYPFLAALPSRSWPLITFISTGPALNSERRPQLGDQDTSRWCARARLTWATRFSERPRLCFGVATEVGQERDSSFCCMNSA